MSTPPSSGPSPTALSADQTVDLPTLRRSKDGKDLAQWVKDKYQKAKQQRHQKQIQWVVNLSHFYGRQWIDSTSPLTPGGYDNKLFTPRKPPYARRITVNRIRSFSRSEISRFISQNPSVNVIPSTAEDQDVRAAYAGEQVWESVSNTARYSEEFARATFWMVNTGNGFLKAHWDPGMTDQATGSQGDICIGSVSPFNFFVPDLREQRVDDQPYVIHAYTKPLEWCQRFFEAELDGIQLAASTNAANEIVDSVYLNLSSNQTPDSCLVYECWLKPGAHRLFPNGGVVIQVDDVIVAAVLDGMPYAHNEYPFTKIEHIPSGTFYADSPIVDLIQLQREYNQLRSDISEAGRRMGRPQILAQQGSIVPGKMTNEPGGIILYRPGTPAPQPIPLSPLPAYLIQQQETILSDWEDITGQHEVSQGSAPPGVTAATAINFLQEQDNSFLTPQYESIEQGTQRIARQTLSLFKQFVDVPRQIKMVGADGTFDTMLLDASDIPSGLDVRVERGSSVSQSLAAKQAQVTQMFSVGLITNEQALGLLELGGPQKVLDYVAQAKKKAQRENIKMKMLSPADIQAYNDQYLQAQQMGIPISELDPTSGQPKGNALLGSPTAVPQTQFFGGQQMPAGPGPLVPVDNFDEHQIHIQAHNAYRMGEEYESLPPEVKQQFELHVALHQQALQAVSLQSFLSAMPSDGTDEQPQGGAPAPGLAGNGAAPQAAPDETGALPQ